MKILLQMTMKTLRFHTYIKFVNSIMHLGQTLKGIICLSQLQHFTYYVFYTFRSEI